MPYSNQFRRQQGATLVVALVILLVMSLVGLASMSSSTLQARMAFNKKQKMLSMLAAEAVLKKGEEYIVSNITGSDKMTRFNGSNGLFSAAKLSGLIQTPGYAINKFANNDFYYSGNWNNTNSVEITGLDNSVSVKKGRYFIEYMGKEETAQFKVIDPAVKKADQSRYVFRVVAVGWGQDANIYSVLQSTFRTGSNVDY